MCTQMNRFLFIALLLVSSALSGCATSGSSEKKRSLTQEEQVIQQRVRNMSDRI